MSSAFGWKDAWDTIDDSDPHFGGSKVYELSQTESHLQRIHPGDTFWDSEENHLWEVTGVRTKVYRGVVGPKGEEGGDCVFLEPDWTPQHSSPNPGRYIDDTWVAPVDVFIERLEDSSLVPHRGNGLPPRPPY